GRVSSISDAVPRRAGPRGRAPGRGASIPPRAPAPRSAFPSWRIPFRAKVNGARGDRGHPPSCGETEHRAAPGPALAIHEVEGAAVRLGDLAGEDEADP